MSIWQFNFILARRLLAWNIVNVLVGLVLSLGSAFWRGFGSQAIGWGGINLGIALVGRYVTERRFAQHDDPFSAQTAQTEARNLRRLLWFNSGLDVLYILGGWRLARTRGQRESFWRGTGWGIVLQGALLLIFDVIHARQTPDNA